MKVAVFTNQFPGRVSTFFARDIRALIEAGLSVDVFAIYPLDGSLWQYVPDTLDDDRLPRRNVHHLRTVDGFDALLPWSTHRRVVFVGETVKILRSAIKFGLAPVAKSGYAALKAWGFARNFEHYDHILSYWGNYTATTVFLIHRILGNSIPFSTFLHAGTDLYRDQVFLRQKLDTATNIFTVCQFNIEFLRNLFPNDFERWNRKLHLYHLGLDLEEYAFDPSPRLGTRLLAVGSFEKCKGFDYLLRAIGILAQRDVPVELDLIGQGPEESNLRRLTEELGIQNRVRFRGWLKPDEVRQAMRKATLLVHPSAALGDAVPTVIKECMALGTPVVGSKIVGIPELLDEGACGALVPPSDAQTLANEIGRVLSDAEQRQRYAERARHRAELLFDARRNGRDLAGILTSSQTTSQKYQSLIGEDNRQETCDVGSR